MQGSLPEVHEQKTKCNYDTGSSGFDRCDGCAIHYWTRHAIKPSWQEAFKGWPKGSPLTFGSCAGIKVLQCRVQYPHMIAVACAVFNAVMQFELVQSLAHQEIG